MGAAAALWVREVVEEPYQADPSGADGAEDDSIEELRDEIATLSAHIDAATQHLLALIARFDRLRGWERAG